MFETILVSVEGARGELVLNRPGKLNALSPQVLREIAAAARWFNEQDGVKVVVVKGNGRAFSAGADLMSFGQNLQGSNGRVGADLGRQMAEAVEDIRAVTIAAIHGWCVGGGLVLAAACDLRVATESVQFSIPEVDLGIPLAWGGIPRLVREIGPALTKELVLTCRPFGADEAKSIGFVNRVVGEDGLDAAVDALAGSLVQKAMLPLTVTKQHVNAVTAQMVGSGRSWADADGLLAALADEECGEARMAYLARQSGGRK